MPSDKPFRIREKLNPPYKLNNGHPEPEAEYDQIDLMACLLGDMNYKDLYEGKTLREVCLHMINQLDKVGKEGLATKGVIEKATEVLAKMEAWLNNNDRDFKLRALYETVQTGDMEAQIVDGFRELMVLSGNRLCFPFMAVQDQLHPPVPPIDPSDMDAHIEAMKDVSYKELYLIPKRWNRALAAAVQTARQKNILNAPKGYRSPDGRGMKGKQVPIAQGGGGGNNRKCVNNVCETTTDATFCNTSADGQSCSTVSG